MRKTRIRVLCGTIALIVALMGLTALSARAHSGDGGSGPKCPADGNGLTMPGLGF